MKRMIPPKNQSGLDDAGIIGNNSIKSILQTDFRWPNGRAHLLAGITSIDYRTETDKGVITGLPLKKLAVRWSGGYVTS